MAATESISTALERNWEMIDRALEGLDDATLARQPTDQCNSIAWLLWHMSRVVDTFMTTRFRETPQLWISEGWHQKFGMAGDPNDRGVGWTADQVAVWPAPARDVQIGYYHAVRAVTRRFLVSVTPAELEMRIVFPPSAESRSVASALGQMTWDAISHGGQIAYLRGFYLGMGWHR
ncbi:MAG: DinB family protein [Dehalococcoidia bacterium]|nr:DinB family protein [Dehalococcoidia bacterium]